MDESATTRQRFTPHVLVVTGMSGAGKSAAANVLEDIGYTVIDNLPPVLINRVVDYNAVAEERKALAVVVDVRGGNSFEQLRDVIRRLSRDGIPTSVLFLEADDQTIVKRYEENRRPHPLGLPTVEESLAEERRLLERLKENADVVIDTTEMNVHELRRRIVDDFSGEAMTRPMRVSVGSFGFKHGTPRDADLMFDARFLPNPHWVAELRDLRGTDQAVSDYVLGSPDAKEFIDRVDELLAFLVPRYEAEGKSYVTVAIGCTGGHHRSVAIAEELAKRLGRRGVAASVRHRDVLR